MDDLDLTKYEKLGPFEIKDFLAKVASKAAQEQSVSYLNAGRGNPNWIATEPREAPGARLPQAPEPQRSSA